MLVIPSIDIYKGKCVQWVGGREGTGKVYGEPLEIARRWVMEGASWLHIIDLDAAIGTGNNLKHVEEILKGVDVSVQVGGGIRTIELALKLSELGAERVIVGTMAVRNPKFVEELVKKLGGERVMIALDSRGRRVVCNGWKSMTDFDPCSLAKKFEEMGVGSFLYTEVEIEGRMEGVKLEVVEEIVRAVKVPVYFAGGVGSLEDIEKLRNLGAAGVVIGMALYEKKFSLREAIEVARWKSSIGRQKRPL